MIVRHLGTHYKKNPTIEHLQFGKLLLFKLYEANKIPLTTIKEISAHFDNIIKYDIKNTYCQIAKLDKDINTGNVNKDYINPNRSTLLSEKNQHIRKINTLVSVLSQRKGVVFQDARNTFHSFIFYYVTNSLTKSPLWLCTTDYLVWYYLIAKKTAQGKLLTLTKNRMDAHLFNHQLTAAHQLQAFTKRKLQQLQQLQKWDDPQVFIPEFYHMTKNLKDFKILAVTGVAVECNVANKKWQSGVFASSYPEIQSYGSYGIAMGPKLFFSSDTPFVLQRRQTTPFRKWLAFEQGASDGDFFPFFDQTSTKLTPEKNLKAKNEGLGLALLSFIRGIQQPDKRPHLWRCTHAWNCQSNNLFIREIGKDIRVTEVQDYRRLLIYETRANPDFFLTITPNQLDNLSKKGTLRVHNPTETLAQNLLLYN